MYSRVVDREPVATVSSCALAGASRGSAARLSLGLPSQITPYIRSCTAHDGFRVMSQCVGEPEIDDLNLSRESCKNGAEGNFILYDHDALMSFDHDYLGCA